MRVASTTGGPNRQPTNPEARATPPGRTRRIARLAGSAMVAPGSLPPGPEGNCPGWRRAHPAGADAGGKMTQPTRARNRSSASAPSNWKACSPTRAAASTLSARSSTKRVAAAGRPRRSRPSRKIRGRAWRGRLAGDHDRVEARLQRMVRADARHDLRAVVGEKPGASARGTERGGERPDLVVIDAPRGHVGRDQPRELGRIRRAAAGSGRGQHAAPVLRGGEIGIVGVPVLPVGGAEGGAAGAGPSTSHPGDG